MWNCHSFDLFGHCRCARWRDEVHLRLLFTRKRCYCRAQRHPRNRVHSHRRNETRDKFKVRQILTSTAVACMFCVYLLFTSCVAYAAAHKVLASKRTVSERIAEWVAVEIVFIQSYACSRNSSNKLPTLARSLSLFIEHSRRRVFQSLTSIAFRFIYVWQNWTETATKFGRSVP